LEVKFAFLCDFAEESGGKLHALGVGVDQIQTPAVPATHAQLSVVVAFSYEGAETGAQSLTLRVIDADGHGIVPPVDGQLTLNDPGSPLGHARIVFQLAGVQFQRYGDYAVEIAVAGATLASLPLRVVASSP
jgi:hypothetical protein